VKLKTPVFVVGSGVISSIGNSGPDNLQAFQMERSGIGPIQNLESIYSKKLPAGEVKLTNSEIFQTLGLKKPFTRTAMLGIHAAREAIKDSRLQDLKRWRTGLISATTVGGMDRTEFFFPEFISDQGKGELHDVRNHTCGNTTELIADDLGIKHFVSTINTACSSSVNSLIFASRLIQHGSLDIAIAGGTDSLTKFTINGFNSLMILDPEPCRPFDQTRNGLNLGEGAGFLILVSKKVLESERLHAHCQISGFANTNDAFHQTASSPDGRGSFSAMQGALDMSGLDVQAINYINLHGTGTVNNDQSEGAAIRRIFGQSAPALSSTKSFTGHTLGACGGIEAAYSVMAIREGCLFPNLRFKETMNGLALQPQTSFERDLDIRNVMSNSFGFGGNCSSIIFSKN
jgi:3-oxoacyl-[acyl-carrier-protein] synthase-1